MAGILATLIRTRHRAQYYFTLLAVLAWACVAILPERLSSSGQ